MEKHKEEIVHQEIRVSPDSLREKFKQEQTLDKGKQKIARGVLLPTVLLAPGIKSTVILYKWKEESGQSPFHPLRELCSIGSKL